ncbi:MAG TPA: hypothetical protein VII50_11465 [Acidothermaceae bacterium]
MTAITFALLIGGFPLQKLAHQSLNAGNLLMLPFALVGAIVAIRQPRNPIGWIMLALAMLFLTSTDAGLYAVRSFRLDHKELPLARLAVACTQLWVGLLVLLPLPILLYPDGRLPSRRWRSPFFGYIASCVVLVVGIGTKDVAAFTDKHIQVDSSGELVTLGGNSKGTGAAIGGLLFLLYAGLALSFVCAQLLAYRRSTGDRREQLKWLMSGSTIGIIGLAIALSPVMKAVGNVLSFGILAVPLSMGVGILKYRLYDIDRLISRTLSYAVVTGALVGVYIGMVTLSTRALPLSSPIAVAASTLTVAALFNPVRRRAQRVIDRRFNRARYDADATIAAFTSRLRDEIDLNQVQRDLVDVVNRSVQPSQVAVWINAD